MIVCPADIAWIGETPTKKTKRLWFDAAANRVVQLTRFEPGAMLPLHRHLGDELIYVIEGDVSDEGGTITAGGMSYRPTGCTHTVTSRNGATLFAIVTGASMPADAIAGAPQSIGYVLSDIAWKPELHGVSRKLVWPAGGSRPRATLQRIEPGTVLPPHRHVGEEFIFVIEGSYTDGPAEVRTADFNYLSSGYVHTIGSRQGATVVSIAFGGVEQVG